MLMTELADHNWSMYAWRMFPSEKQVFWRLRHLLLYGFGSSKSRLRKFLLSQELRRFPTDNKESEAPTSKTL